MQLKYTKCAAIVLAVALAAVLAASALTGLVRTAQGSTLMAVAAGGQAPVIIIDPGHGGADGGAVGVDGIAEENINLEIAFTLRDLFVLHGFEVVMTREDDTSIHDPGVSGLRAQKTSDLRNRLAFTQRTPDNIFISIHQNKFADPAQWGAQVFYGPKNPGSELLAEAIQRSVVSMLQPENRRAHKQGGSNLYVIYEARSPAVLVECGFLSNPQDARNLTQPEHRTKLAFAIFCGVLEYLGFELPASIA